jgi:hypothetical protein
MNLLSRLTMTLAALFSAAGVMAQIGPPPPPGGVPVDGGASILLAAGAAYGARKLYQANRDRKDRDQA